MKRIYSVESKENSFLSEFSDCFGEIGTLNKTHHIAIKDNFIAVVTLVLRTPHSLNPKVEKKPKYMVDLDLIEPIDKPTDWVNGLVILEKPNGKLRICVDPRPLNQSYQTRTSAPPYRGRTFFQM